MKVSIRFYARGNAGATEPSEELINIAEEIRKIWEKEGFNEAIKFIEDYEFNEGWEYKVDYNEEKIEITNYMLIINKYGAVEGSWGFERAEIFKDNSLEEIKERYNEIIKWGEDAEKFEVVEINKGEYAIYSALISLPFEVEEEDVIDKETFVQIVNNILNYLYDDYLESPPSEQAKPICSSNPYAWDEPGWNYKINDNLLTITTSDIELIGACYHTGSEQITFKKINKKI